MWFHQMNKMEGRHIAHYFRKTSRIYINNYIQMMRKFYITTSNVYWNHFELDKLKTMLFADAELEKCTVQKGDLKANFDA